MTLDPNRPVSMVGIPHQTGKIVGAEIGGFVYVRWDQGGGNNVDVTRLVQAPEDKAWPPRNLETK